MIPEDLFRKIQGFHFRTRRQANELFAGGYESAFKGRGMEFAEVREYQVGDDIRAIDWNVSARFGHPYVKVFHEERELTVMLLLDISGSHAFGTRSKFKRDLLAEVAGMLAFLAVRTNDKVGAILCSQRRRKVHPPEEGGRARLAPHQGSLHLPAAQPADRPGRVALLPEPGGETARHRVPDFRLPGRRVREIAAPDREETRAVGHPDLGPRGRRTAGPRARHAQGPRNRRGRAAEHRQQGPQGPLAPAPEGAGRRAGGAAEESRRGSGGPFDGRAGGRTADAALRGPEEADPA